jgi:molybdopterin converting factor small subunit
VLNIERLHVHAVADSFLPSQAGPNGKRGGSIPHVVTITLMGQLQTTDGDHDLACELSGTITVRELIRRQGRALREVQQLLREKKLLITVNKRIASEDTRVQDGDTVRLVAHDGMGGTGLGPSL